MIENRQKTLADHVLADLRAQRDELLAEFSHWQARADEPGPLAQHKTQIARITDILSALLTAALGDSALAFAVDGELAQPDPSLRPSGAAAAPVDLAPLLTLRRPLGAAHFFWDFFRDKLAQRDTSIYANHLDSADILAWKLYQPFWERVAQSLESQSRSAINPAGVPGFSSAHDALEALKEPPLTFYHADRLLFAQPRSSVFRPPGLDAKDVANFGQALARLPVPIIGLPWYKARRMPALIFVGHEVGHVVAEDLGLGEHLDHLLGQLSVPKRRADTWLAWRDEVFADIFGTLALGRTYVEQLAVELADERADVQFELIDSDRPGDYPTRCLRIALCQHVLAREGLMPQTPWYRPAYPIAGDSDFYADDIPNLVDAIVSGPYPHLGGVGLRAVLPWSERDEQAVVQVAESSLAQAPLQIPAGVSLHVRHWVAGAVHARMLDPIGYHRAQLDDKLAQRITREFGSDMRSDACTQVRRRLSIMATPHDSTSFSTGFSTDSPAGNEPGFGTGAAMGQSQPAPRPSRDRQFGAQLARDLGLMGATFQSSE